MRNKQFYINAIKMDLYRVVVATGDIRKKIPVESVQEFMQHALLEFNKIQLTHHEKDLKNELQNLSNPIEQILNKSEARLKWTENILTIRCRL